MKILVDVMPENAAKCKFHGEQVSDKKYKCKITGNLCPMNVGQTCRILKPFHEMLTHYRF